MPKKRSSAEQIVAKLRRAEVEFEAETLPPTMRFRTRYVIRVIE